MMENPFSIPQNISAILVSATCPQLPGHSTTHETERSLNELSALLKTLNIKPIKTVIQNLQSPHPATVLGMGKIKSLSEGVDKKNTLLVFDCDLKANQLRNIKKISEIDVIDRCTVILEIFARHALTKEAKIQIEIAKLEYLLPRLTGLWAHFSRQKGGIGIRGGEGEQQIELDRRIVRQKIERYKTQLEKIAKSRKEQGKRRQKNVLTAALVGHTNAGKSSLMNQLCQENVLVKDQLFATLDSTYRALSPNTHPPLVLIDTVGFLSNLPTTLINGFKTTLESIDEADLLILVIDISDEHYQHHLKVTLDMLKELGVDHKKMVYVYNKKDLIDPMSAQVRKDHNQKSFVVSSFDPQDVKVLREFLVESLLELLEQFDLYIPYSDSSLHYKIRAEANIVKEQIHKEGVYYRVKILPNKLVQWNLQKYLLDTSIEDATSEIDSKVENK